MPLAALRMADMTSDPDDLDFEGLTTLRDVHAVYAALVAERGGLPSRRDLDPLRFGRLLPSLMLLEAHHDKRRLRVRLAGEVIERHSGLPGMRGRWIDETQKDASTAAAAYESVAAVLRSGRPRLAERQIRRPDGLPLHYAALTLPLATLPGEPPMVLVAVEYR